MRSKWTLSALAVVAALVGSSASAQTIAYINALQFDLQSFRNQATGGVFLDDVDKAGDATRLLEVEGNRVFTNLSNISEPALQGDRLLTYSLTQIGKTDDSGFFRGSTPVSSGSVFDSGSFLGGWIGRTSEESENVFSVFYQSNGQKTMFEDLEDFELDADDLRLIGADRGYSFDFFDAEIVANLIEQARNTATNEVFAEEEARVDLKRFDDRTATDFDFGFARDINADLAVGARLFFEKDALDRIAEGRAEFIERFQVGGTGTPLLQTERDVETYTGPGEDAYKQRDMGVSLNADLHQWADQSLNVRVDVFSTNLTNPGISSGFNLATRGGVFFPGAQVDMLRLDEYTTYFGDDALDAASPNGPNQFGNLLADHEARFSTITSFDLRGFPSAVASVDDERTGLGLGAKLEYDRECAGGDSRTWVALARKPYDIEATIVQRGLQQNTFWWNGDGFGQSGDFEATYTSFDQTATVTRTGDMNWTTIEGGGRWTKDLSNTVSFGGGLIATRTKATEEYAQENELVTITDRFDDGSGALGNDALITSGFNPSQAGGEFLERQTVTTENLTVDVDDEQKWTTIRIPVGLQFHFAQKWTWNMGSLHEFNWWNRETSLAVPVEDQGGSLTQQTYFNGTTTPDPDFYGGGSGFGQETIVDKTKFQTTTFYYGLEWDAAESLSFYINGMFESLGDGTQHPGGFGTNFGRQIGDVEFWRSLAVSAKIIL